MYHWFTTSYAKHKASDKLYENILEITDKFIESYIGRMGKPTLNKKSTITVTTMNDIEFIAYMKAAVKHLETTITEDYIKNNTDLQSIRDDLIAQFNKTIYLFALA
jgi:hypothetical protein